MDSGVSDKRTRSIRVGSLSLLGSTGVTLAVGLVLAGVLARYFSPAEFGMWAILMSLNGILINGFDFGFGNALRNKLAQLYGQRRSSSLEARVYFFSIFYWFVFIALVLTGIFFLAKSFIPWETLFSTSNGKLIEEGSFLIAAGGSILAFNIPFNLNASGFFGYQESHWNALSNGLAKLGLLILTLLFVFFAFSFLVINLLFFLITLGGSVISFLIFLKVRKWPWQWIYPKTTWAKVKELWKPSAQFAALQIFSTILLNADYFVVSKVLGLEMVGDYFLVKRIYLVLASFHFAFLLPIWSAYTESVETRDFEWMDRTLRRTVWYTLGIFSAGIIVMLTIGDWVIFLWTGKRIQSFSLFFWLGIWGVIYGWNNCFSVFLNGTGHLKWQVFWVGIAALAFVPLALYWGARSGLLGVCFALIAVLIPLGISNPVQSMMILESFKKERAFIEV
jgi:O-antigen/teichoic acid export membrane protein